MGRMGAERNPVDPPEEVPDARHPACHRRVPPAGRPGRRPRSHHRPRLGRRPRRLGRPDRPPLRPGRTAAARPGLPAGAAQPARAQERLAVGRGRRRGHALRRPAPAGAGGLGRRGGPRRIACRCGRAARRSRRGAGGRRNRLPQERDPVGRGAAPVLGDGGADRKLPMGGVPGLCHARRPCLPRPRAVPAPGVGRGRGAAGGGGGARARRTSGPSPNRSKRCWNGRWTPACRRGG
jgi:hypothetical protein